ncbi:hypothetical protein [Xylella fastidiosa]|uniref:Uncharacterized protein n=1 Tax=Xylella fastidiosa subsp. fastidiosa TaxID=644356 RepID=A0AAJ5R4U0_XYLFS|nr:hypothetical protein [Xylella fastidiosa]WCF29254.1 hypothetical protein OK117_05170 [Xylella fastidiosa subsp. fastidiosa]
MGINTQPKPEENNQTIKNMEKNEKTTARIKTTVTIANLTKKRHPKLSLSEFHKSIINKTQEKKSSS